MNKYLFQGSLDQLDPKVHELIQIEAERQYRRLILIPSESTAPVAIRESLASVFQNLYAEGYPAEVTRLMTEDELLDYRYRLAFYRRYADLRYYKGTEYADVVAQLKGELKELRKQYKVDGDEFAYNRVINEYWDYDEDAKAKAISISHQMLEKNHQKTWPYNTPKPKKKK